ncbi:hypothetical protein [Metabacillus fastidiosus]|uniref:hypothetical protein n=1 Tax=Metabacillus fastidiosus TaxID=1458 RepID=UPI002E1DC433|nr:hypothetical protein [Metabacillus fastidiosus]
MAFVRKKRLDDGKFGEFEKIGKGETEQEKQERIEAENAQLIYDSMMKDMKLEEVSQSQADLIYQLMQKGVL